MRLSFYGAAGEVTGSCYLLETPRAKVLIDFGLHQGGRDAARRNHQLPPIDWAGLDVVVLTHAHLDHSGRLPLLLQAGFRGLVKGTPATLDLCGILLRDAAAVQAMNAERVTRSRLRRGLGAVAPLYGSKEVEAILKRLSPLTYDEPTEVARGVTVRLFDAGHILGSASVEMTVVERPGEAARTVVFSGDIGVAGSPLLRDPVPPQRADVLILESTYGDRDHKPQGDTVGELSEIIGRAGAGGGKVLIPAFAVGRTQQLVYHLGVLSRGGLLASVPVFVDSPMAVATTDLYRRHRDLFDADTRAIIDAGDTPLAFPSLRYIRTGDESRSLNRLEGGAVVISASGMCTGGRILHHLKHNLWKPETHLVFVGFQAHETLGRRLVDGAKRVTVMGEPIAVKATIHTLGGLSAHAGQSGLIGWASHVQSSRPRIFLTHGEEAPRAALRGRLDRDLGLKAETPAWGTVVEF